MKWWQTPDRATVFLSLHHGDDILESMCCLVREAELPQAVVMTGLGSLRKGHVHVVASNAYPPGDTYHRLEGPLEIAQVAGIIADGLPHLHMTFLGADHVTWAGHVEPGCEVLTLCEMSLLRVNGVQMVRRERDG
ncbi:MAG: DNA-binding protein, partial [Chloroflexi bacterium]|nr:DNA-binding protein [Chloroflexota bacterium]